MGKKPDKQGGNGDIIYIEETGTVRKYLRNTSSKDKIPRFKRELEIFQEICRNPLPNVVTVIDVHIDENRFTDSYVEMVKYDGSLYDILEVTKGNVKASLELLLPIIKVLHTLSENNPPLYHRDIKPDNILFLKEDEAYTLYLTDFGTCFLNDGSERLTPETMAVGPRMYIAPEYETGRVEEVTEKGDIFSIGKVIWCMINGEVDAFMPSNFWFVDTYDLTKRFPDNAEMIVANTIISSCLSINPDERCSYPDLIHQIESYLASGEIAVEEEAKYKVKLFQEKRRIELQEIQEKNKLLVNRFSHCFINALVQLCETYTDFELLHNLHDGYRKQSKDGVDYTSTVNNYNAESSMYYMAYDGLTLAVRFVPAERTERYGKITISYKIFTSGQWKTIFVRYNEHGVIVCNHHELSEQLCADSLYRCINTIVMEYIK